MSWQQAERQAARSKRSGRYVKLNPCQRCGKSAGANYCSDSRCETMGRGNPGLVLCPKCAQHLATVPDTEYLAEFAPEYRL